MQSWTVTQQQQRWQLQQKKVRRWHAMAASHGALCSDGLQLLKDDSVARCVYTVLAG